MAACVNAALASRHERHTWRATVRTPGGQEREYLIPGIFSIHRAAECRDIAVQPRFSIRVVQRWGLSIRSRGYPSYLNPGQGGYSGLRFLPKIDYYYVCFLRLQIIIIIF
jgi:hypothetical protein